MTILSTITTISKPSSISKSSVYSNKGGSLSMGSNSVACGGCGGGSSGSSANVNLDVNVNVNLGAVVGGVLGLVGGVLGGVLGGGSGSCGCN